MDAQILLTFLGLINRGGGEREFLNELKCLHFHKERDIHMNSKNYEANDYIHDMELAII